LRISIAYELYGKDAASLGKVYEIASLDIEEMKEVLHERGIVRKVHTTPVEIEANGKRGYQTFRAIGWHVIVDTDFLSSF